MSNQLAAVEETNSPAPPRRGRGRRYKLTASARKRVLRGLELGLPVGVAVVAAGIGKSSFHAYRNRDDKFAEQCEAAIAAGIERRMGTIEAAQAAGDWRASAWILEHCHPQHFAKSRLEVTGQDGQPLALAVGIYLPQKNTEPLPAVITTTALPAPHEKENPE